MRYTADTFKVLSCRIFLSHMNVYLRRFNSRFLEQITSEFKGDFAIFVITLVNALHI
jgi:hypothetical protein